MHCCCKKILLFFRVNKILGNIYAKFFISILSSTFLCCIEVDRKVYECSIKATINADNGISIESPDCGVRMTGGKVKVGLIERQQTVWYTSDDYKERSIERKDDSTVWILSGEKSIPDPKVILYENGTKDFVILEAEIINPSDSKSAFIVSGLELLSFSDEECECIHMEGLDGKILMLHNGDQSWSFSGIVQLSFHRDGLPREDGNIIPAGNNHNLLGGSKGISWWFTGLKTPSKDQTLVVGALTTKLFKTFIGVEFASKESELKLRVFNGGTGDRVEIKQGENLRSDKIFLGISRHYSTALDRYAKTFARLNLPLRWNDRTVMGWSSWYYYFSDITEQDVIENSDFVAERLLDHGYKLIQIDDGYQRMWGVWEPNEKFPSGLEEISHMIEQKGLSPGIWVAPLLVDVNSAIFNEKPGWFLRDWSGEKIIFRAYDGSGSYGVIDITNPHANSWLRDQIENLVNSGFKMFKIDFMFAGAYEGNYAKQNTTSMAAYREALMAIRDAAGEDVFILACGAPIAPTVGYAHGMRTGPDIAYSGSRQPNFKYIKNQMMHTAARYLLHDNWFINDSEQVLIREPLTLNEAEVAMVSAIIGGGILILGDRLNELTQNRLNIITNSILTDILKSKVSSLPHRLFDYAVDEVILSPLLDFGDKSIAPDVWSLRLVDGTRLFVIFNWGEETTIKRLSIDRSYEAGNEWRYEVVFPEYEHLSANKEIEVTIGARSVKIIRLSKIDG